MAGIVARFVAFFAALVITASALLVPAQENGPKKVSSPFQDEFETKIGLPLELGVMVDDLLWRTLLVDAGDPGDYEPEKMIKTVVTNEVENLGEGTRKFEIVLLLEDERGRQLHRITLRPIKVGSGRFKKDSQKFKIEGRVLADTSKIYIFAEVK